MEANYPYSNNAPKITDLLGKTFKSVKQTGDDELVFTEVNGNRFVFYHSQSCCEGVTIDNIVGDLSDLENSPILKAEEATSNENPVDYVKDGYQDSFTWTFYKFATQKGYVDIRWYGESNGYYSERVDLRYEFTPSNQGS
jgi:hypothetical protein